MHMLRQNIPLTTNIKFMKKLVFKYQTIEFDRYIGHHQVVPLRDRVELGAMAKNSYSTFSIALALLEPYHQMLSSHIQDTRLGGVVDLCKDVVGVFYSPNRLYWKNCNIGPMCCALKKEVRRKRNTQTRR